MLRPSFWALGRYSIMRASRPSVERALSRGAEATVNSARDTLELRLGRPTFEINLSFGEFVGDFLL